MCFVCWLVRLVEGYVEFDMSISRYMPNLATCRGPVSGTTSTRRSRRWHVGLNHLRGLGPGTNSQGTTKKRDESWDVGRLVPQRRACLSAAQSTRMTQTSASTNPGCGASHGRNQIMSPRRHATHDDRPSNRPTPQHLFVNFSVPANQSNFRTPSRARQQACA